MAKPGLRVSCSLFECLFFYELFYKVFTALLFGFYILYNFSTAYIFYYIIFFLSLLYFFYHLCIVVVCCKVWTLGVWGELACHKRLFNPPPQFSRLGTWCPTFLCASVCLVCVFGWRDGGWRVTSFFFFFFFCYLFYLASMLYTYFSWSSYNIYIIQWGFSVISIVIMV